ncbi:gasdermin-C-like [Sorex fumeus]|uniref:gasdermin-C-like n=1 Tax=Sorex fumeus TaxID=62283 RepID=UPI0024AD9EFF|nr:gasdermin-C-like [Sorex fumeus]
MVVIFDEVVKRSLRQFGKRDLKPVPALINSEEFHCFNVVRKKKNGSSSFWNQPDIPTGFSLLDILDLSSPVPDLSRKHPIIYEDKVFWKGKGSLTIDAGVEADGAASGETNKSYESTLKLQINEITAKTLTELQSRPLLKPESQFLEQCRKRREDLYVVTKTLELINCPQLCAESGRKWLGKLSIPETPFIKGQGQVTGDKRRQQSMKLLKNKVLAYQTKQLIFKKDGCEILHIKDKKQMTFPHVVMPNIIGYIGDRSMYKMQSDRSMYKMQRLTTMYESECLTTMYESECLTTMYEPKCESMEFLQTKDRSEILPIQQIEEPLSQDFKQLQVEISRRMGELSQFSKNIQDILFHNILVMLGDREALQDLQDMMEQFPQGDLNGPGGIILNELRKNSENLLVYARSCILYLLEALLVLNDTQLYLLAWSMKEKILVHQRELVRSILEPNFKYPWRIPFTLKPELLTPLQDEGVAVTYKLLEECGLKIDLNSNRSAWDLEAKMPLSALYGCLSLLQQLAVA